MGSARPRARSTDLVVEPLLDEILVYDRAQGRAPCLNPTAARLWQLCDGTRTVAELEAALAAGDGSAPGVAQEGVARFFLAQLAKERLLEDAVDSDVPSPSRRDLLRRLGVAAAALPVITSISL